jgi:hypothetical protein
VNASTYWLRVTLRRKLRALALLVVVIVVGAGGAIGAATGARRGVAAAERLAARSAVPEVFVTAADPAIFDDVTRQPEVAARSGAVRLRLQPEGVPCDSEEPNYFPIAVPVAGVPFAVPRPRLVAGRFPDQARPREALISEQHARRLGIGVGDEVRYVPWGVDGGPGCASSGFTVEVVGVVRELFEIGAGDDPVVANTYLTQAFLAAHPELSDGRVDGWIDLVTGAPAHDFVDSVARRAPTSASGEALASALVLTADATRRMQPALDAGAAGMWALAAIVALVAGAVLALGISRFTSTISSDLDLLAVLGMSRGQRAAAAAGFGIVVVALGLPLALGLAALLSTAHLVGLAAIVEPEPGLDVDVQALAIGTVAVVVVVGLIIAVTSWRAAGATGRRADRTGTVARTGLAERVASMGAPTWVALGTGYALGRGRRTTLPARSALLGVAIGSAGVVGVLVFGLGVAHASTEPAVYGWGSWDGLVNPLEEESGSSRDPAEILAGDQDVAAVATIQIRFRLSLDGEVVGGTAISNVRGRSGPTVVRGRLPVGPSEIALGGHTASGLGVDIGSTVDAEGPAGMARLDVVGVVAFPDFDSDLLDAGWTADREVVDALGWPPGCNDESECFETTAVAWRAGTDVDHVAARIEGLGLDVVRPAPGPDVRRIAETAGLPRIAAGIVALIAAAGLAHTLDLTVRRRRRELAVMRALGFERAHVRRILYVEGFVLGAVGGMLGCLAGLVLGRMAWRAAARRIGIGAALPSSTIVVAIVLASATALGVLLAIVPAHLAVRDQPARGLQEER